MWKYCWKSFKSSWVIISNELLQNLIYTRTSKLTPGTLSSEKLIVSQVCKKYSSFYKNRTFIAVFTRARHLALNWARWIQPTHIAFLFSVLLRFSKHSLLSGSPANILHASCLGCHTFHHLFNIWQTEKYKSRIAFKSEDLNTHSYEYYVIRPKIP
jgi:hypothetical protein